MVSAGSGGTVGSATVGNGGASGAVAIGGSTGVAGGVAAMPPFVSDPNGSSASQLQIAGGYLYWLSGTHQVARALLDGSQVKTVFTHPGSASSVVAIGGFAVDDQHLYFSDEGDSAVADRGVYQIALDGSGTPLKLADGNQPAAIALDGDTICFTDGSDLRQVKTTGGAALTLLQGGVGYRTALLISDGYVYFPAAFGADAEDLYRLPLDVADPGAAGGSGGTAGGSGGAAGGSGGAAGSDDAAGGVAAGTGGAGGAADASLHNGAQKISTVPGRYDILLAQRADNHDIYWGVEETIYKWSGTSGGASSVAVVTDPVQEQSTAPPHSVLVPFDGTLYWVGGSSLGGYSVFKQALPSGARTVVVSASANSVALDGTYLYVAAGTAINRYAR